MFADGESIEKYVPKRFVIRLMVHANEYRYEFETDEIRKSKWDGCIEFNDDSGRVYTVPLVNIRYIADKKAENEKNVQYNSL